MALRGPVDDQRIETSTVDARNAPARPEIFRLTEVCAGNRRVAAARGEYRPSGPRTTRAARRFVLSREMSTAPRSPVVGPPGGLRNSGVESPQQKGGTPHANALAGPTGRRDRRAVGAPRRRDRAPPRSHPRVRHPRGLEHRIPLLRRLAELAGGARRWRSAGDRKSTRLNSSHLVISYAVFCLKKKKI